MDKPVHSLPQPRLPSWRQRHTETSGGAIRVDLGKLGLATPETSVRGGLCCLLWRSLDFVAKQRRDVTKAKITCAVTIGQCEGGRAIMINNSTNESAALEAVLYRRLAVAAFG